MNLVTGLGTLHELTVFFLFLIYLYFKANGVYTQKLMERQIFVLHQSLECPFMHPFNHHTFVKPRLASNLFIHHREDGTWREVHGGELRLILVFFRKLSRGGNDGLGASRTNKRCVEELFNSSCRRVTNRKTETMMDDTKVGGPTVSNNLAQYCSQWGFYAVAVTNFLVAITKINLSHTCPYEPQ
jgi:hypothetical protein